MSFISIVRDAMAKLAAAQAQQQQQAATPAQQQQAKTPDPKPAPAPTPMWPNANEDQFLFCKHKNPY